MKGICKDEKEKVLKILKLLEEHYPNATTALRYENPFQLLVATILSAQCTDKRVNQVTQRLFEKYKGPEDFANLKPEELENEIRECGLFKNKSRNIIGSSRIILEKYGGRVPDEFEELVKLPGVGRKTANVILANAFGKPAFAVDTHVFRVSRRLGLSDGNDPLKVEKDLNMKIPEDYWIKAHHWLIYHGRRVCTARKPNCENCFLKDLCRFCSERGES
ncbi:MAG: endonuclease [Tepidanaerobacteraceae bacterium]|nr:endonuclease [Tepidanaerobacteraceae bacterium]